LFLQIGILAFCSIAVWLTVVNFPYPSPLIKPLLPPKLRWPSAQIAEWVEAQNYDPGFLEYFARDPERAVPPGDGLVSAADGVVKDIIFDGSITYFIVGLSFWDVHFVRTPVAGVVKKIEKVGLILDRDTSETDNQIFLKGKDGPVQEIVTIDSDYGEIKVRLITSYFARRLIVSVHEGDRVEKGVRIGRILLGSSVVVEIPGNIKLSAQKSQRVVGGETAIFEGANPR
jgi:phosphatidylserine decarboxylase